MNVLCKEKIWFEAGREFCTALRENVMHLTRALYDLKSSGASWRKMFKDFIKAKLGFKSSRVDPDMYYRRNTRDDGSAYYKLLLVYVDNELAISHVPKIGGIPHWESKF